MGAPKITVCAAPDGDRGLVLGFAIHEDRAYAVGGQGRDLFLTSNDGVSFKEGTSPGPGLRSAFARDDGLWVVGEYGYIARSNDRGVSWKRLPSKSRACLFGVAEDDLGTMWFAGEASSLWSSKNGDTLKPSKDIPEAIGRLVSSPLGVLVPTDKPGHLFLIRKGKIDKTKLEAGDEVFQATVTPRGTIVTAGLQGLVHRSEDGGETWTRTKSGVKVMLTGIDSFVDGRVVIVGDEGLILLSEDDGKSFTRLEQFVSAGTLWCVKRYGSAILIGGEDGLVMGLGDLVAKAPTASLPVASHVDRPAPANPAWAAPPPSTERQSWTPPPPMPLEVRSGIYVTPEFRAMLFPRRQGIAVPLRPLPTIDEAWGTLRRALWAADRARMQSKKAGEAGIWNLVTAEDARERRLGERLLDAKAQTGSFDDDVRLISLSLAHYRTFIVKFHDEIWDALADFVVASVGLPEAVSRFFTGLDDELPYTDCASFGRLRDLFVLADDATYTLAKRAVVESLAREAPLAAEKRDDDRRADLHWAATFLLPLGPGASDEDRRVHEAALKFTGEFGNADVRACGLASGDLTTLELFRKKNRKTRHEFFSPTRRSYLASILELEGSAAAEAFARMKPAEPFDDDAHYNGRWCTLLAHIADDAALEALHGERKSKVGRIWGTAGLLLSARSDPDRVKRFATSKGDKELVALVEQGSAAIATVTTPSETEIDSLSEPFPYEPPPARRASFLVTKPEIEPEIAWRDAEREVARERGVYDDAVKWNDVALNRCSPAQTEELVAHREKWALPTSIQDLALAPTAVRERLVALGFSLHEYWARFGLGSAMLSGGLTCMPMLLAALAEPSTVEAALAVAQPFGDVSIVPAVASAFAAKKMKAAARSWMLRHPKHAIAGAIALVQNPETRDDASRVLRYLDGRGKRDVILELAKANAIEASVREMLDSDPLAAPGVKTPVLPKFATPAALPPLVDASKRKASPKEVERLLLELAFSNADEVHPGVIAAKAKYTEASRAAFAWALLEAWLEAKADPKHGWCMQAVGFFGDDESARKLAALAKVWPGENASARAYAALDALLNIGMGTTSPTALVNINLLAEKSRYPAFKAAAKERIETIADARGLSTEELQDRLVPSLGLDDEHARVLDYGKRKFTIEFDEMLRPVLRDAAGVLVKDVPKPIKTDNAALAKAAKARFSGLRKDARASASLQIARLERAMQTGRTIERDVFVECFAEHPWMRFLAQRIVWAGPGGKTFRVAEDGTFADVRDVSFKLPEASVQVVHPLSLDARERDAWSKLFADYTILQPFPQLGRATYEATDAERKTASIERFRGKKTTYGALRGLEARGWEKWIDAMVTGMARSIARGTWVHLEVEPGWHPSDTADTIEPQTIDGIVLRGPEGTTFGSLSPITFSEVIYDVERAVTAE